MDEDGPIALPVGKRLEHAVDVALHPRAPLDREAVRLIEHKDVAILDKIITRIASASPGLARLTAGPS